LAEGGDLGSAIERLESREHTNGIFYKKAFGNWESRGAGEPASEFLARRYT